MNEKKYILQYGSLAGWPFKIAQAMRNHGVNSQNVVHWDKDVADLKRELSFDRALCDKNDSFFKKSIAMPKFIHEVVKDCSLVHYHSSNIFFRELHWLYEGPVLKRAGIPMLLSFGGSDARPLAAANALNPYFYKENNRIQDAIVAARYKSWSKNIKFCATDPEFRKYAAPHFEKVFSFRQPVDLEKIKLNIPSAKNNRPLLLHIPTDPKVKGTEEIIAAVDTLKAKGMEFDFRLKRRLTQSQMYEEIANCDVYIDELKCGSHGVTAVETMAAGKPTVTYIRPDLLEYFPESLPLVNANPDTIANVLEKLIANSELRKNIGQASRLYVETYHDVNIVVKDLLKIYDEIS
jgi:glycosyltransferase involved in cell wall biosynthesis